MRISLDKLPYQDTLVDRHYRSVRQWPAKWIACAEARDTPFVTAYRHSFTLEKAAKILVHVSADERYRLFLDGEKIGDGSERGDAHNWFFESYELDLSAGEHLIVAQVWSVGAERAFAQLTVHPGFILSPQDPQYLELLGTGSADWEVKVLGGYGWTPPLMAWGTGLKSVIDGAKFSWGFERGEGEGWKPAKVLKFGESNGEYNSTEDDHYLTPAMLPAMLDEPRQVGTVRHVAALEKLETRNIPVLAANHIEGETAGWQSLIAGTAPITIPANTRRRVLVDLDNYYCAYPHLTTSGGNGATVRVDWTEALYDNTTNYTKSNRDEIEGKYFAVLLTPDSDGVGDSFKIEGGQNRHYTTLWWQCGRYVEIAVETGSEPLTIEKFSLHETRYPLEMESRFEGSDSRLQDITPIMLRGLQMCSHETYMDCPYYEQMMYTGDTRLEVLINYSISRDDRLPRKALRLYDSSRLPHGLTQSRYPARSLQVIPTFCLWYVQMIHDYALYRDDLDYVRSLMPGARGVLDYFQSRLNADGLLEAPEGWNFVDWVETWMEGNPLSAGDGVSGILNWHLVMTLDRAADLEEWLGEPELADRAQRMAAKLATATTKAFWNEERGLFADDLAHTNYSEHAQCMAVLSGHLDEVQRARIAHGLLHDENLDRATIMFRYYLLEAFYDLGLGDALSDRLDLWFNLTSAGFKTTFEQADPTTTRSDCHAWGAHPLYHYYASLLGIRPVKPGFSEVRIEPQLGPLQWANGTMVHPAGQIVAEFRRENDEIHGSITLPEGVSGTLVLPGRNLDLNSGLQQF